MTSLLEPNADTPQHVERILRRVEIQKLWQLGRTVASEHELWEWSRRLCRAAQEFGDLRCFNAALKLNDRLRVTLTDPHDRAELERIESLTWEFVRARCLGSP